MNFLHLKYAVEVEKTGSISQAAQNLYMNQPHLSKAIRELEDTLGSPIFNRTAKGVIPTRKGLEFLAYAKKVLAQVEEMEALYKPSNDSRLEFDIAVPRASYVSYAFTEFLKSLPDDKEIAINYQETNSMRAIKNVFEAENNLAIIRYQTIYEKYFLRVLEEKELKYQPIWEFEYLALMSAEHVLAKRDLLDYTELSKYPEITHGDITIPSLPLAKAHELSQMEEKKKRICVYERGSQFEILCRIPTTYMWVSPMPQDVLDGFSLVQKKCNFSKNKHRDILIYRHDYYLTKEDNDFMDILRQVVEKVAL